MRILLVDDDPLSRKPIARFLKTALGHEVVEHENGADALEDHLRNAYPIVISDIRMPKMTGTELLREIAKLESGSETAVVLMTGFGDLETAIVAVKEGAKAYLKKPIDIIELSATLSKIVDEQTRFSNLLNAESRKSSDANNEITFDQNRYINVPGVGDIGVFSDALRVAVDTAYRFHEDRSIPVLIEGETGTGKEILARLVHHGRGETDASFIPINCTAISSGLFESDLFGYESGAFSGARREGSIGKLDLAQEGTLFLDEVGDMPLELQPKLLRVLQEREMYRVGGTKSLPINVRIVAATNLNLAEQVEKGFFRKDLYYRLNPGRIFLPSLHEEPEAIIPLAQMFLANFSSEKRRKFRYISKTAQETLQKYPWPGNIRELHNTIERITILFDEVELIASHLSFLGSTTESSNIQQKPYLQKGEFRLPPDAFNLQQFEDYILKEALKMFGGNRTKVADYLGLSRNTILNRLKK